MKTTNTLLTKALLAAIAGGVLSVAPMIQAETVRVPVGQQGKQKSNLERPVTGMKQSQVETVYGKPVDWRDAVGDPPISSWIYPDFVVYFEYDRVIHSVLKDSAQPVASTGENDE